MGLTKLYVPREKLPDIATPPTDIKLIDSSEENVRCISDELSESEKALIERFEGIVRRWIKQIREALANASAGKTGHTVFDELQHWKAIR